MDASPGNHARVNILVTGANGFLARAVAAAAATESRLVGLVRPGTVLPSTKADWGAVHDSLESLVSEEPTFDVVLHLAALIPRSAGHSHPDLIDTNVGLPSQLATRYPMARHVLASSVSVYGTPAALPLSVDSPTQPSTPYGWSKLSAENFVRTLGHHAVLRLSSVIGRGMRAGSFIPTAVAAARAGCIQVLGDGSRTQDYIDVRDAAAMCLEAAGRRDNFTTLAVSGRAPSNLEVANVLAELTGSTVQCGGKDESPSFAYTLAGAVSLGPCQTPLRQSLREMVGE